MARPNAADAIGVNNPKYSVENKLPLFRPDHLVDAQKAVATDWTTALQSVHP